VGRESSFLGLTRRLGVDATARRARRVTARRRARATARDGDRDPTTRDGSRRRTAATTTTRSVRVDGERAVVRGGGVRGDVGADDARRRARAR
jgi:hypothetical protein